MDLWDLLIEGQVLQVCQYYLENVFDDELEYFLKMESL